ncbi:hypothetical protein BTO30_01255 [Domibacillus antri]|uniref:Peptidase S8/S53 domain-containing protein n=1 Tax=Domibacillus antri TaxID=1714264 RepID=A0A1Q8Q9X7_9BACI|nr:S8 family serine peptidase [Domibacillus antri]OLN24075.1 hypothetical protein BTO30_01255 [Domibacillus antri]
MYNWKKIMAAAVSAALVVPAAASAETLAEQQEAQYKAAQQEQRQLTDSQTLVIKYSKALPHSVHKKAGVSVVQRLPELGYDVVKIPASKKVTDVIKVYKTRTEIVAITPSVQYKKLAVTADPKKSQMDHLALLNADKAFAAAGKHDVTIAVIDGGVDFKHPDLKANLKEAYNVINPARNVVRDKHGTHVAGIISSVKGNDIGGYGVFPKAKILSVDVFNDGMGAYDYNIAKGIIYAVDKGADVINLSLGGNLPSSVTEEAVQYAIDSGVVVVAAAGNEASDEYFYPAAYPGVISVGNVNSGKKLSESSNYGASVDVVAPGEDIYSTGYDAQNGSKFERLTGTSMASPMVAAAAGLLKSKYPDLTAYEIEYILEQTATDLGGKGYDLTYGNGLINPLNALKFDLNKLPDRPEDLGEELLQTAKEVTAEKQSFTGAFKSPGEMHWYKANLAEGEHVQTSLSGSANYDYAMELYFVPEDGEPEYVRDVNKTRAGKQEGYLYTAAEAGTLLIGVKDANGNYNAAGKSSFTFEAEKMESITPDETSLETPVTITSFPFIKNDFTLYSPEEGMIDKDYYTVSVTEPKYLSVSVSGLPGVDTVVNVAASSEEEGEYMIVNGNYRGVNDGEEISFQAVPGMNYRINVSNGVEFEEDPFENMIYDYLNIDLTAMMDHSFTSSAYPYTLNVEERQMPADEDGIEGEMSLEDSLMDGDITFDEYGETKEELLIEGEEEAVEENDEELMGKAIPYTIGESRQGYFQTEFDVDYYRFTPSENAIYTFEVSNNLSSAYLSFSEYDEETKQLIPLSEMDETDLLSALAGGGMASANINIAFEKGKTYVVQVLNSDYSLSTDPYTLTSKKAVNVPAETDNDQNTPEEAMNIALNKTYQNYFIRKGDIDYYYYKNNGKVRLNTLDIVSAKLTAAQKASIPGHLRRDHLFMGAIIEDTNGDKVIDEEEKNRTTFIGLDIFMGSTLETEVHTSFEAKQDTGYFIRVISLGALENPNLTPYQVRVGATYNQTADGDGKVVNHIPAKPIALKTSNGKYGARGYFNAGIPFGDTDHFVLNMTKTGNVSFSFDAGKNLDGVVEVYNAKGALVTSFDRYGKNDVEIGTVKLEKGKYYIELSEANGTASTEPYELIVKK